MSYLSYHSLPQEIALQPLVLDDELEEDVLIDQNLSNEAQETQVLLLVFYLKLPRME